MSKILAWSKCKIEFADALSSGALPSSGFTSVGTIKDKSSVLSSEDGDTLEAKSTGGELVGYEKQEGTMTLETTVIEPDDSLFTSLGLGSMVGETGSEELCVSTHVVGKEVAVKVTPHNVGAKGIAAPKCTLSVKTGWSEEEGNYAVLTFGILHGGDFWYKKFTSAGIS